MNMIINLVGVILVTCIFNCSAYAQYESNQSDNNHVCQIKNEKKKVIESFLCGQTAPEKIYRFYGPGCAIKSFKNRVRDTAIQIHMYEKCNDTMFAERMKNETSFINMYDTLTPCLGENFDAASLFNEALTNTRTLVSTATCTSDIKAKLAHRKTISLELMSSAKDFTERLYQALQIKVTKSGRIIDAE